MWLLIQLDFHLLSFTCSAVSDFVTPWTAARQAPLSFTVSRSLVRLMSMPSNHLILCRPLLLLPSILPSIRVFSHESALRIRRPEYWSFSISSSSEYPGLISFTVDWFDLLAVQGAPKSLLQHHQPLYGSTLTSVHDSWENHSFD